MHLSFVLTLGCSCQHLPEALVLLGAVGERHCGVRDQTQACFKWKKKLILNM